MKRQSVYDKYRDVKISVYVDNTTAYSVLFITTDNDDDRIVLEMVLDENGDWMDVVDESHHRVLPTLKEVYEARKAIESLLYSMHFKIKNTLKFMEKPEDEKN